MGGYAVSVFRRRTTTTQEPGQGDAKDGEARVGRERAGQEPSALTDDQSSSKDRSPTGGKGRPTPKRREAEAARKTRIKAPRDRKEALRQQRAQARQQRLKVQEAMKTGDERYLPARDKGPVRRFVRNFVDSRRTASEYLLPYFLVIFLIMLIPLAIAQTIALAMWLPALVLVPLDLVFLGFRLRRELRERFPDESHRGAVTYGIMRATQLRRLRLPKPQVKPGEVLHTKS